MPWRLTTLAQFHQRLVNCTQLILGASSVIQSALPAILENTPTSFYEGFNAALEVCIVLYGRGRWTE
jgi:hypothetical protein